MMSKFLAQVGVPALALTTLLASPMGAIAHETHVQTTPEAAQLLAVDEVLPPTDVTVDDRDLAAIADRINSQIVAEEIMSEILPAENCQHDQAFILGCVSF